MANDCLIVESSFRWRNKLLTTESDLEPSIEYMDKMEGKIRGNENVENVRIEGETRKWNSWVEMDSNWEERS